MIKLDKVNPSKSQEYVQAIYSRRGVFFNYFGQSFEEKDAYMQTENTFMLLKPIAHPDLEDFSEQSEEFRFSRVYVASNDRQELIRFLSNLKETVVLNFPVKGDIRNVEIIMLESGFKRISTYERFIYNVEESANDIMFSKIEFASEQDVKEIYQLYFGWRDFNPCTDWLPTREELREFVKNKSVIVNKKNDKIVGVNICPITGNTQYLRLIIDLSGGGLKLMNEMFEVAQQNRIKRCQWWVNSQNKRAISFYQKLGAIHDGLKDYTFIKNKI